MSRVFVNRQKTSKQINHSCTQCGSKWEEAFFDIPLLRKLSLTFCITVFFGEKFFVLIQPLFFYTFQRISYRTFSVPILMNFQFFVIIMPLLKFYFSFLERQVRNWKFVDEDEEVFIWLGKRRFSFSNIANT